jgi:hypothetical protein
MEEVSAVASVGLCTSCKHVRRISSELGSVFFLCRLSAVDPRFAKYPRLPVLSCSGYENMSRVADSIKIGGLVLRLPSLLYDNALP